MNVDPEIAVEPVAVPAAGAWFAKRRGSAVVLIGTWIGLIAGLCDVSFLVMNRRLIDRDFYRLGADFPWIVPLGVTVLILVPTLMIALVARIRGSVRLFVPVALLWFIGFLELSCRLRIQLWATVIISGAGLQSVRWTRRRGDGFLRLVRWTIGLLVAMLIAIMFLTAGGRLWSEYRQLSSLPPAARHAERAVARVGHGAGRQHEFAWVPSTDDTES